MKKIIFALIAFSIASVSMAANWPNRLSGLSSAQKTQLTAELEKQNIRVSYSGSFYLHSATDTLVKYKASSFKTCRDGYTDRNQFDLDLTVSGEDIVGVSYYKIPGCVSDGSNF